MFLGVCVFIHRCVFVLMYVCCYAYLFFHSCLCFVFIGVCIYACMFVCCRYPDGHMVRIIGPINDMKAESEAVLEHTGITWQVCMRAGGGG